MFYGSGNGVVKILNASDMAEIADAVQTVTWNRYNAVAVYHWNRYSVNEGYVNQLEQVGQVVDEMVISCRSEGLFEYYAYGYTSYDINTETGTITLSNRQQSYGTANALGGTDNQIYNVYFTDPETTDDNSSTKSGSTVYRASTLSARRGKATSVIQYKAKYEQSRGSAQGEVTSENSSQYPNNGISGSYWYVKGNTTYRQGTYIDQVTSRVETAYPTNGYQDGYWYVLAS